ncbi:immunoglobulin kappa light chain-like [Paramisgurnus dabryanus]|uniref:immunoglobulin kappa light chain-like n=1 Tax=Paramisgurnus dabryanus TaxID=90735 RepID=UPI0031F411D2
MTTSPRIITMICIVIWTICCIQGSVGEVVTQSGDQTVEPGQTVTIECKHTPAVNCWDSEASKKYCMSWYHQIPGEVPKLLIYYTSKRASDVPERFSGSESGKHIDFTLTISKVQPEDSGVYYCTGERNIADWEKPQWRFTQCESIIQKPSLSINNVKTDTSQYTMHWYHQIPGEVPKLLIYYTSDRASGVSERFSGSEDGKHIDFTLTISKVQPEDSGVYYCQST